MSKTTREAFEENLAWCFTVPAGRRHEFWVNQRLRYFLAGWLKSRAADDIPIATLREIAEMIRPKEEE